MASGFEQFGGCARHFPVILSVPHAGRAYPADLDQICRFPAERLLGLEDRYADLLVNQCRAAGFAGLIAHTPRALIDLNRAEQDMDPGMLCAPMAAPPPQLSAKARGGLGLIPRRTPQLGEIWRHRFHPAEVEGRIARHHRPYHRALTQLLRETEARFGCALLVDVHSMPPLAQGPALPAPDIVIGDRFGRSATPELMETARAICAAAGHRVAFNAPYAGGHILERHAAPTRQVYALQIEIDRRLYLDAALVEPGVGLAAMASLVHRLCLALGNSLMDAQAPDSALPQAAE
ncbi:MAG: N-formylglutamate amidohydrolase [Chakrabartia sp.]